MVIGAFGCSVWLWKLGAMVLWFGDIGPGDGTGLLSALYVLKPLGALSYGGREAFGCLLS